MNEPHENAGRRVLRGTGILMLGRSMAMVFGLLQTVLIAKFFGATSMADAFFVAAAVPVLLLGVVENNLGLTFTPLFVELEHKGDKEGAWTLAATLFKGGSLIMGAYVALTIVLAVPLAWLLAPGFDSATRGELVSLILCMSPLALSMFISSTFTTMCFIRGVFVLPAATHIISAACPCLSMILLRGWVGIYAVPMGLLLGSILGGLMLFRQLGPRHALFRTPMAVKHPAVKQLWKLMVLRTGAMSLLQLNTAVDRMFASRIAPGHIAHLAYAHQIIISVRRIFIVPLGRSLMPVVSRAAAAGDSQQVRMLVKKVTSLLGFAIIPLFVFLIGFRHEAVELLLARGAFSEEAVRFTGIALLFYSLGAFSMVLNPVLTATLFAFRDSLSPLKIVAVGAVLNIALNYLFIQCFSFGGIALATSGVATVASVMLWRCLARRTEGLDAKQIVGSLLRTLLAALAMLAVARGGSSWLHQHGQPALALELALCLAAGGLVYMGVQAALNRTAFERAIQELRRILARKLRRS